MNFAGFVSTSLGIPRRLAFPWGRRLLGFMAAVHDVCADGVTHATGCRFPKHAPSDALTPLGRDRVLLRGPGESDEQYRARIVGAWEAWQWGGTSTGILSQLEAYGLSPVLIANYEWDAEYPHDSDNWSRFWIVLPPSSHAYVGSFPSSDEATIRSLIRKWKDGCEVCVEVIAVVSGRLVDWPFAVPTVDEIEAAGELVDDNVSLRFGG